VLFPGGRDGEVVLGADPDTVKRAKLIEARGGEGERHAARL
jgi:hypothetical protein